MLGQWRQDSASNAWTGRDGAGLLELNGDVYMLGGWNTAWTTPGFTTNEVWMRPRGRQRWQRLPDAPWAPRHTAGWQVHDGKLFVVGGDANSGYYQKDMWCAMPFQGGLRWALVTSVCPWAAQGRVLHNVFSFQGKIVVMGGQTLDEFITDPANKANRVNPFYDDIWTWSDGVGWQLNSIGHAWAPCGMIMGGPVKDGHMWLVGGGAYNTAGQSRVYKNSVWKSNNITDWQQVTPAAAFPPRQYNNAAVLGDRLVTAFGYKGVNMQDLWSSIDGVIWREHRAVPVTARHAASMCRANGELLVAGGPLSESSVHAIS